MKLLLFSDLHLARSFTWAPRTAGRRRRQGLRATLTRVLALASDLHVDAVVCGGDLFEHDRISADTSAFLRSALAEIHPLPVLLAPGNHDWYGPDSAYRLIDWSPNVHVFTENAFAPFEVADGVTVWGAAHRGPTTPRNLLDGFRTDRGGVNLALFHGSEQGFLPFVQEDKQPHAPFRAEQIQQAGLDHALLGHFHTPKDAERYTYPGNPDPLEFGEKGERGAVLVDVSDDGSVARTRHRVATTVAHDLEIAVTRCDSVDAVCARVSEALPSPGGWIRITLRGEITKDCQFRPDDLAEVLGGFDAWTVRTGEVQVGYDLDELAAEQGTVRGEFVRSVRAAADLSGNDAVRVLITGLRAFEGRDDLEVL